jgi:hypothetical protein
MRAVMNKNAKLANSYFTDEWLERERKNYLARKPKATVESFYQHVFETLQDDPEQMERVLKQVGRQLIAEIRAKQRH